MTRMNVALIAAVVILSGALALAASLPANPQSQNPPRSTLKPIESEPNGRYQIANGTPEMTRNIMLLDTQTGKTWIICEGADGTAWCAMNTGEQAGRKAPDSQAGRTYPLLGEPSGASDGATIVRDGVTYVSKSGKWQLP